MTEYFGIGCVRETNESGIRRIRHTGYVAAALIRLDARCALSVSVRTQASNLASTARRNCLISAGDVR